MKLLNIIFPSLCFLLIIGCIKEDVYVIGPENSRQTIDFDGFDINYDEKGGLVVVSDVINGFYDLYNLDNTSIGFTVDKFGEDINAVDIYATYKGNRKKVGSASTLPSQVNYSFSEIASVLDITNETVAQGESIRFSFDNVQTSSGSYKSGTALNILFSCSSDIGGTYNGVTTGTSTDDCCPDLTTVTKTITLEDMGGGKYKLSDWSGGLYLEWYDVYGITAADDLSATITDVCGKISGSVKEPFDTDVTITGNVDTETGIITINWENGYADKGTLVLTK